MNHVTAFILALAVGALVPSPGGAAAGFTPLTRDEAAEGRAVCVTGVVTCVAYWQTNSCVIASVDDPNGSALYVTGEHPQSDPTPVPDGPLEVGDVIEVKGVTVPLFFAPGVYARSFRKTGVMGLPAAPRHVLSDFAQGLLDNRRARFEGVVTVLRPNGAGQTELTLATCQGPLDVRVRAPLSSLAGLSDAEVEVEGVAMSVYNHRAEYLGMRMEVSGPDGIIVRKPASVDPFLARKVPLDSILAWSPRGHDGHRRMVSGTVTAANADGTFYLQSGARAVRATVRAREAPPRAGTAVDAVGFPEMVGGVGQLLGVVWRESSDAPERIEPVALTSVNVTNLAYKADITFDDYDCQLVSIAGRLFRIERKKGAFDMFLEIADISVGVSVPGDVPGWIEHELEFRPMVSVTGIARLDTSGDSPARRKVNGRTPGLSSVSVEARGPDALRLVPDAQWRERHRVRYVQHALYLVAALLLALIGVGAWALWRSRARERDSRLLADERKRMAGDLHDTIEQHLAGAKILLSTAADKLGRDEPAAERAVKMAGEVLAEAKRQIRDVILNLRSDRLLKESTEALVAQIANELNSRGIVKARVKLRGIPPDLSAGEKSDLVAIVQQAVTNALNHGRAKNVAIVSDPAERTGTLASPNPSNGKSGFVLRILNDGEPFDASKALGPESGHFGLANMRERAKRSGMLIDWCREGRWMCVKVEG